MAIANSIVKAIKGLVLDDKGKADSAMPSAAGGSNAALITLAKRSLGFGTNPNVPNIARDAGEAAIAVDAKTIEAFVTHGKSIAGIAPKTMARTLEGFGNNINTTSGAIVIVGEYIERDGTIINPRVFRGNVYTNPQGASEIKLTETLNIAAKNALPQKLVANEKQDEISISVLASKVEEKKSRIGFRTAGAESLNYQVTPKGMETLKKYMAGHKGELAATNAVQQFDTLIAKGPSQNATGLQDGPHHGLNTNDVAALAGKGASIVG